MKERRKEVWVGVRVDLQQWPEGECAYPVEAKERRKRERKEANEKKK